MEQQPQKASLGDIISYTPETYFSDEEIALIRSTFNGSRGQALLKVVRKALIPSVSDPDLPVEEFGKDMFMSAVDFRQMATEEVKPTILGLQLAGKVIFGALMQLRSIANIKEETAAELAARRGKNSTK